MTPFLLPEEVKQNVGVGWEERAKKLPYADTDLLVETQVAVLCCVYVQVCCEVALPAPVQNRNGLTACILADKCTITYVNAVEYM